MPYKDPEKKKEYDRRYREINKEKIKESNRRYREKNKEKNKEYREKNKEKIKEYMTEYLEKNKEKVKEYQKTSPIHYKNRTIKNWKYKGIIDSDYDLLFQVYNKETHCWICGIEFDKRINRHLDHDHDTGEPRYICCRGCNNKLK